MVLETLEAKLSVCNYAEARLEHRCIGLTSELGIAQAASARISATLNLSNKQRFRISHCGAGASSVISLTAVAALRRNHHHLDRH